MKPSITKYQSLSKRLGLLDAERRQVIQELKSTPEGALAYLTQVLNGFVDTHKGRWFSRTNEKNETAYFKVTAYEILPTTTMPEKKGGSVMAVISLTLDHLNYGSLVKTQVVEKHTISVFNEVQGQILNGRKFVENFDENFDEKKMMKASLNDKKSKLKEEMKKLDQEIAAL